ncbi:MAG: tRNA uridine-5-carboxymethylaminomethyl(34) synthesis GTPase MnmE [Clostridia bacterium]|nr:tRNA uridine-5-carboxymethylaminomethyl(34) synthesis GTPase MnmE [Clostridia bacterium]
MTHNKTVAAVSTPHGKGGIAVIRISGDDAFRVADKCFRLSGGKSLSSLSGGSAVYGRIYDGDELLDDGIATVFRAPRSFTGEDVVEIACHGGILNTRNVLGAVLSAGAYPAGPGEFTRRAFISGKLSLTAAEAVADIIDADTEGKLKLSRSAASGKLSEKINELYSEILTLISSVYAIIDYPEEDLAELSVDEIRLGLASYGEKIDALISTYRTGRAVADGIETTVLGRPNVGKSAVYNRILGEDRAIVTDIEGTTRDLLYDRAVLGDVTLNLCDTAGLRESSDTVEKIGIERAADRARRSELVFLVFDGSSPLADEDREVLDTLSFLDSDRVIVLINKKDLGIVLDVGLIKEKYDNIIEVSAVTGEGFDLLSDTVSKMYIGGDISLGDTAIVYNARQYASLKTAGECVSRAANALENGFPPDVVSVDLESAMAALGECDGRAVGEDIVRDIFSRFCVGK